MAKADILDALFEDAAYEQVSPKGQAPRFVLFARPVTDLSLPLGDDALLPAYDGSDAMTDEDLRDLFELAA